VFGSEKRGCIVGFGSAKKCCVSVDVVLSNLAVGKDVAEKTC